MNRNECLKIMYLSPVAVDDYDELFGESFKEYKEPGTEVHVTSLNANRGQFSHVEFRSFEAMATPGIISATICAAKEGFDALVIGCFYDTALHCTARCERGFWQYGRRRTMPFLNRNSSRVGK